MTAFREFIKSIKENMSSVLSISLDKSNIGNKEIKEIKEILITNEKNIESVMLSNI